AHNRSEVGEPAEQSFIGPPDRLPGECRRSFGRRVAYPQRGLLRANVDLCVPIGGVEAHVAEPATDDVDLDTGLQQMNSRRVSKHVGPDAAEAAFEVARVPAHDLVDAEARQRLVAARSEDGAIRRMGLRSEQEPELMRGLSPERAEPPLVALAVKTRSRGGREVDVAHAQ